MPSKGYSGKRFVMQLVAAAVLVAAGAMLYRWWTAVRQLEQIQALRQAIERLESERPAARVRVLSREPDPAGGVRTTFEFQEINRSGIPLPPSHFTIEGDVAYFDAWVIKFAPEFVKVGDPFKGRSIHLFRRVFGERQRPVDGFPLVVPGDVPGSYRTDDDVDRYERFLWKRFWTYALSSAAADKEKIRVAQGEAVYTRLEPGRGYTLTMEANGGLSLRPDPEPRPPAR